MTMSHTEAVAAQPRSNPGETLRLAREERGWQVAEVASQLNLAPHALVQLEAGQFERLPGHTFARGYVRAYAKLLGLDQAALVAQFDHYTGTDASGSTVHSLGHVPEPLRLSRTVLRLASAVLLILLLALAWFWWQERPERLADLGAFGLKHIEVESADGTTEIHPLEEPEDQAVAEALQPGEQTPLEIAPNVTGQPQDTTSSAVADPAAVPAPMPAPQLAAEQPAAAAAAVAPALPPAAVAPNPLASAPAASAPVVPVVPGVVAPQAAAAEPAAPVAEAAPATPAPAAEPVSVAAGEGLVQVSFSDDCWTQVTDANGRVLVSAVKRKGETLQVAGKAPLEVRLGFARGAQLSYNGAPVNLRVNSGGTARVTLGQ